MSIRETISDSPVLSGILPPLVFFGGGTLSFLIFGPLALAAGCAVVADRYPRPGRSDALMHEDYCLGGHTSGISCSEVARLRHDADENPWFCSGATRSGYHRFGHDPLTPESVCSYEGCDRTWGELSEDRTQT